LDVNISENERIDDLQYKGLRIIQKKDGFCFGVDAVLLANYADIKPGDEVIDLGTGTGIIPILLAGKTKAQRITGLEIQNDMAEMALRSIKLNGLQERVYIVNGDIKKSLVGAWRKPSHDRMQGL
jgi:tRNA1(Val) A37 N6-methylase TrmN6